MFNLMNVIINNNRNSSANNNRNSTANNNRNSHTNNLIRTRNFNFNSGYNSNNRINPQQIEPEQTEISDNISNTFTEISTQRSIPTIPAIPTIPVNLVYTIFNTIIDISSNIHSTNLFHDPNEHINIQRNEYYSAFTYESLNIRFFHNEIINESNVNNMVESVISSINEREIQHLLNEFEEDENNNFANNSLHNNNSNENSEEIKNKINNNITQGEYGNYAPILKNSSCPILLTEFQEDDIVVMFNLCEHAIHGSTYEKFIKLFKKCPLCNSNLCEL